MATRLRKTRKFRGSRNHGWGQVGQHRASGHKGGLGQSGMLKHHFSTMLKDYPDHFGHSSNNPPTRNIIKKWAKRNNKKYIITFKGSYHGQLLANNLLSRDIAQTPPNHGYPMCQ